MAVFSTNQNRHLYVAKFYNASVDDTSEVGTIGGVKVVDGALYFKYKGPEGTLKSDHIQLKNLDYAKAFKAKDMATPLKSVKITLDPEVNGGAVVAGEDYILRISFRQWIGGGDEHVYFKDGAVHGVGGMTAEAFYQKMADSLNLSFSREIGATKTSNPYLKFEASANGLVITEKEQDWTLGIGKQEPVLFEAQPTTIYNDAADTIWGKVEDITPSKEEYVIGTNAVGNGKKIADMEWFYMGERGDQYRNVGWPNVIETKYLVDPSLQYNVLEIHHAFTDTGVNSYRSEKDITIVASDASVLNSLIAAINKAANTEIEPLKGN